MTKRFTIEIDDENIAHILDNDTDIGQYNLCKLLNNLFNENEQLKDALNQRTDQCDKYYKENEQLKEENKDLEEARSYYQENFLTMKTERNQLKKENRQLIQENKELKQKIESLKMEIAELRESEKDNYNITDGLW